jgi:hypothetical protein
MQSAFRSTMAVVLGFVAACVVMMAVEFVNGHALFPELGRQAAGMTDREAISALMARAPFGAFLVVILGWAIGSFAGGIVAARIAQRAPVRHAVALGVLLTLAGVANNLMIPPPPWFWAASLAVLLPGAWAGGRFVTGSAVRV